MVYRIKQFFKGLLSILDEGDLSILDEFLSDREREIFMKLPKHERSHAIDTAMTMMGFQINKDKDVMIKAALLHDIGKVGRKTGIIGKSILVLSDKFFPHLSRKLSNRFNMFYVYYNHPSLGAKMLKDLNTDEKVISLVEYHHSDRGVIEGIQLLKKADSLN